MEMRVRSGDMLWERGIPRVDSDRPAHAFGCLLCGEFKFHVHNRQRTIFARHAAACPGKPTDDDTRRSRDRMIEELRGYGCPPYAPLALRGTIEPSEPAHQARGAT